VLFPDGKDNLPRLKNELAQAWTLNALANSYAYSGRSREAISLFEMSNGIYKKQDANKRHLAICLGNLADNQMRIGELNVAEANFRRMIEISREIKEDFEEVVGHRKLGQLLAYQGEFGESEKEIEAAIKIAQKLGEQQNDGLSHSYLSIRSLLMSNAEEALNYARKSRELAGVGHYESHIIRAEWLLGAAYLMKANLPEAEKHLTEALKRDRKINLVVFEPDILLEFAKLWLEQNHKEEALEFAEEALLIADRCKYRLKQADIHNVLAEFYLAAGNLKQAKKHGEIAKERAECGYKPALEKAEKLLNSIEQR